MLNAQSIYDLSFNDIDGNVISVNSYVSKRVLFYVVPLSVDDSLKLDELGAFCQRNGDSIQVIGLLSLEDGYNSGLAASIKSLYQSRGISILLTTGMNTRKSSGSSQSDLMNWLTERDQNRRFDLDASGIGHKFFVSKTGKLVGSFQSSVSLSDPLCDRLVYLP